MTLALTPIAAASSGDAASDAPSAPEAAAAERVEPMAAAIDIDVLFALERTDDIAAAAAETANACE